MPQTILKNFIILKPVKLTIVKLEEEFSSSSSYSINTLTANEKLVSEMINNIQNPEEKEKQLIKFIESTKIAKTKKSLQK